jgi:hypothetical protein
MVCPLPLAMPESEFDLTARACLMSGHRIELPGGLIPLNAAELRELTDSAVVPAAIAPQRQRR